ncbi:MAG: enoyl-CoA hydratase-related protein [Elusimicrobiota bacterium]
MTYKNIFVETSGSVLTVTLNRPEARNALNEAMLEELAQVFGSLGKRKSSRSNGSVVGVSPASRVVVLKGAGLAFCAGADIKWMKRASEYSPAKNRRDAKRLLDMLGAVYECSLPTIARVHGSVYGGALGVISACDIVVAEEKTAFCFSECRVGIIPAVVSTFVLPKIGPGHARRWFLTSDIFSASTAKEMGLIHQVAVESGLDRAVENLVGSILKNSPDALKFTKEYVRKMQGLSHEARLAYSLGALVKTRSSAQAKEGFSAFIEKRPPVWS